MEAPEVGVRPLRKFLEGFQLEIRLQCVGGKEDGKGQDQRLGRGQNYSASLCVFGFIPWTMTSLEGCLEAP